jgi:hypothetical protein
MDCIENDVSNSSSTATIMLLPSPSLAMIKLENVGSEDYIVVTMKIIIFCEAIYFGRYLPLIQKNMQMRQHFTPKCW